VTGLYYEKEKEGLTSTLKKAPNVGVVTFKGTGRKGKKKINKGKKKQTDNFRVLMAGGQRNMDGWGREKEKQGGSQRKGISLRNKIRGKRGAESTFSGVGVTFGGGRKRGREGGSGKGKNRHWLIIV